MLPKKREEVHTAIHLWCSVVLTENRQGNKDHVFLRDQKKSSSIHGIISALLEGNAFQHPITSVSTLKFQPELLTEIFSVQLTSCSFFVQGFAFQVASRLLPDPLISGSLILVKMHVNIMHLS